MKTRILLLFLLATICTVGVALRPPPKDLCLLSLKPVFQDDDEQVWHLTIETREPTPYWIDSALIGGGGSLGGDTARSGNGRGRCQDGVWFVFSLVSPSGDGPAYLKTLVKSESGSLRQTREVARGTSLSEIVAQGLIGDRHGRPQNTPIVLADMDGQRVRLMVGAKSDELDAEQGGAPNAAPPRR
jgi:hypothetical protein